jgi:hypothetical protein
VEQAGGLVAELPQESLRRRIDPEVLRVAREVEHLRADRVVAMLVVLAKKLQNDR